MDSNRRDFLTGAALAAAGTAIAGCASSRGGLGAEVGPAPMLGFCAPKIERVRIGIVGVVQGDDGRPVVQLEMASLGKPLDDERADHHDHGNDEQDHARHGRDE